MTKKHNPLENPPAASSSDDDEELDSSAGEEEEQEEEVNDSSSSSEEDQPKPPSSSSAVTTAIPAKTSDSHSGSETETDSESDIAAKSKNQKPPPPPTNKSGTKRPSEVTSKETNSKRAKKEKKPAAFHRLWTEEDEIAVLQGMIDFKKDTGNSPYDDTNAYFDYIKKSISFEVSKNQFMDKLRSLKKKYMGKEKKPCFTKPHEHKSYRLCKFIWGPDGMGLESAVKSNGGVSSKKRTKKELSFASSPPNGGDERFDWFEKSFLVRGIAGFGVDESYVRQRWRLVPVESRKKVEEKVKMLQAKEIEFVLHKTEILRDVTSMIAEASKNRSH
ncbi:DNA-binding storekeeper protein-related transcriptional regulator [Raphanus sativus]|uniref:Probable transcription factor At1g61730 n=1 Tax=Raphanus sativus TaxID=3726 RepID=A0A6J0JGZ4_RAPSA|nr:probable transcription factor At1g61730 [Raphanus sativus]XP_056843932.1 probable transcription factor At1g61730 [Raphanus sativus]XP_056843994.1 probable transcription factor At1g61730 [Raphanus sativus]KAJ4869883.1 DNA-binding storekeeper protein-related transcriptional regulator [Raphanus sativus]KAJ4887294.1 DNA-binding storekeeper protein-related transcriptional regulator [Raphanus sativus]KAJ4887298.1 DNA-binding storekeeper protein-related transcriptional regulator [Raphanus sativus]